LARASLEEGNKEAWTVNPAGWMTPDALSVWGFQRRRASNGPRLNTFYAEKVSRESPSGFRWGGKISDSEGRLLKKGWALGKCSPKKKRPSERSGGNEGPRGLVITSLKVSTSGKVIEIFRRRK